MNKYFDKILDKNINDLTPKIDYGSVSVTAGNIVSVKNSPDHYRLAKKQDGTLVLQGAYFWQDSNNVYGHDWRDIETVIL